MILIGENIHIISKSIRAALENRDESFISDLIKKQSYMDYIDLNVGPAKNALQGILPYLVNLVNKNSNLKISLDTTNFEEMQAAVEIVEKPSDLILNSTSADIERLEKMTDLASENDANLIALTLNKQIGIPKTADGRLELAFEIYEKAVSKGIDGSKIFFDPLILPVSVDQSQSLEALNTIKMLKESLDVKTTIGLSNISNGSPIDKRAFLNRIFFVLASGAGLDSAIVDSFDKELIRISKMLEIKTPSTKTDELYLNLFDMMENFGEIEDIKYDTKDELQVSVIKATRFFLNKEIYSGIF